MSIVFACVLLFTAIFLHFTRGVCKFCKALSWTFISICLLHYPRMCLACVCVFSRCSSNFARIRGLSYAVFLCNCFPFVLHCSCTCCIILAIKIVQILSPGTFVGLAAVPESCRCSFFHVSCPCFLHDVHYLKKQDFEYRLKSLQDNTAQFT